jgi:hypothetical protein
VDQGSFNVGGGAKLGSVQKRHPLPMWMSRLASRWRRSGGVDRCAPGDRAGVRRLRRNRAQKTRHHPSRPPPDWAASEVRAERIQLLMATSLQANGGIASGARSHRTGEQARWDPIGSIPSGSGRARPIALLPCAFDSAPDDLGRRAVEHSSTEARAFLAGVLATATVAGQTRTYARESRAGAYHRRTTGAYHGFPGGVPE